MGDGRQTLSPKSQPRFRDILYKTRIMIDERFRKRGT